MSHPAADARSTRLRTPGTPASLHRRLIEGGGSATCIALALLFGLDRLGLSTRDTMTLLPAGVCLGLAAVGLGALSLCVRELRRA